MFCVATLAGATKSAEAYDLVPQGPGGAARASGLDIGLGLQKYFSSSTEEVLYGRVRCNPQAFQDDIARLAENIHATNYGNAKISQMLKLKIEIEIELRNTSLFLGFYSRSRLRSNSGTHPRF